MSPDNPHVCRLDHLVVTAKSCADGVAWIQNKCGITIPVGGEHPLMGTHNHLTALGSHEFLEIIATNPLASAPKRRRWFNLDDEKHQARLEQSPELSTWVVATQNLTATLDALKPFGFDAGQPVEVTRGNLHWKLAFRDDGSMAFDGLFPLLIQWPEGINAVSSMQDQGMRLKRLSASHPEAELLKAALTAIGVDSLISIKEGETSFLAELAMGSQQFTLN